MLRFSAEGGSEKEKSGDTAMLLSPQSKALAF